MLPWPTPWRRFLWRRRDWDARLFHCASAALAPRARDAGALLKRSIIHDHVADGLDGLITVIGVRYIDRARDGGGGCGARRPQNGQPSASRNR